MVAFDKVHENTKDITASATDTYPEAANLAINQVLIRSINTSVVALLPVGALLFIGAGLLGAGTLKDLGLVLFIGMAVSFYSSLFFAAPLLIELKLRQPRFAAHTQRVLAKRAAQAAREARQREERTARGDAEPEPATRLTLDPALVELAGAAPSRCATGASRRVAGAATVERAVAETPLRHSGSGGPSPAAARWSPVGAGAAADQPGGGCAGLAAARGDVQDILRCWPIRWRSIPDRGIVRTAPEPFDLVAGIEARGSCSRRGGLRPPG